jgi:hypothetical protein
VLPLTENPVKKTFANSTQRAVDGLSPRYYINGLIIGGVEKSHPPKLHQFNPDNHFLQTSDIDGAQAGYISKHQLSIAPEDRREFRNTNYIGDISGAQSNTALKCIRTTRSTNPLFPVYQSLDSGEVIKDPEPFLPVTAYDQKATFKMLGHVNKLIPYKSAPLDSGSNARRAVSAGPSGRISDRNAQMKSQTESEFQSLGLGSYTSQYFDTTIEPKSYSEKITAADTTGFIGGSKYNTWTGR